MSKKKNDHWTTLNVSFKFLLISLQTNSNYQCWSFSLSNRNEIILQKRNSIFDHIFVQFKRLSDWTGPPVSFTIERKFSFEYFGVVIDYLYADSKGIYFGERLFTDFVRCCGTQYGDIENKSTIKSVSQFLNWNFHRIF